ncbi:CatB-related O-acetyltransferase [Leptolyngbya sp. FACHB-261]|nr:CatB-related O-acetyltransferase [Leptolyngbya sp. FACHB-261]
MRICDHAKLFRCEIGTFTYIGNNTHMYETTIGKFCSIGPNCQFGLGMHPSREFVSSHPIFFSTGKQVGITFADRNYFEEKKPIEVGNDVWIGANVTVLDGVTIADGAIIAAGAVVTKDVPPYAIYGGIPAKLIRHKFEQEQIEFLLNFKWWNQDEKWLKDRFKDFHNIDEFIRLHKPCSSFEVESKDKLFLEPKQKSCSAASEESQDC